MGHALKIPREGMIAKYLPKGISIIDIPVRTIRHQVKVSRLFTPSIHGRVPGNDSGWDDTVRRHLFLGYWSPFRWNWLCVLRCDIYEVQGEFSASPLLHWWSLVVANGIFKCQSRGISLCVLSYPLVSNRMFSGLNECTKEMDWNGNILLLLLLSHPSTLVSSF